MKSYTAKLNMSVYPKEALLKAAYSFVKEYYVHLEQDEPYYHVTMTAKEAQELPETIGAEFENELLAQTVRHQVYHQTHRIRELLIARAMASTMVMDGDPTEMMADERGFCSDDELDTILEDWFEHEA